MTEESVPVPTMQVETAEVGKAWERPQLFVLAASLSEAGVCGANPDGNQYSIS